MTFLRFIWARARFTYFDRLEFGDDCYSRNRLLDHIDDDGLDRRGAWQLPRPHFFRCDLLRPSPFGLRLRQTFFWRRLGYGPIRRFSSRRLGRLVRLSTRRRLCFQSRSLLPSNHGRHPFLWASEGIRVQYWLNIEESSLVRLSADARGGAIPPRSPVDRARHYIGGSLNRNRKRMIPAVFLETGVTRRV